MTIYEQIDLIAIIFLCLNMINMKIKLVAESEPHDSRQGFLSQRLYVNNISLCQCRNNYSYSLKAKL